MSAKYIFVTGGVVSSLGKGLAAASIGCLLESRGLKVNLMKFDPYLNVDPGTMSPFQHGEVFVTDDGAETDLDLGHYERFTHARLTRDNNLTTGRIYEQIITKERRGDYLGKTVQVIPHVTNEINNAMRKVAADGDVTIVEIGGTVGDIESLPFLEAIRQMRQELGRENTVFVHVTLVPWISAAQELKTKPTQHSVKELLSIGIQPDILLCRTDRFLSREIKSKIALFCNLEEQAVITAKDVDSHLRGPARPSRSEGVDRAGAQVSPHRNARSRTSADGPDLVRRCYNPVDEVSIAIVGKYVEYEDSYKSLKEALVHGALAHNLKLRVTWIEAEGLEEPGLRSSAARLRRHSGSRRLRQARHRGHAQRHPLRTRAPGAVLRHLPRHADRLHRVRAQCLRPRRRQLQRIRSCHAAPRHLQAARADRRRRNGRYHAPRCLDLPARTRLTGRTSPTAKQKSANVTVTVTNSTANTRRCSPARDCTSPELPPTAPTSRSSRSADHPFFLGCQFHPEFKSKPLEPHPLFANFVKASYENRLKTRRAEPAELPKVEVGQN